MPDGLAAKARQSRQCGGIERGGRSQPGLDFLLQLGTEHLVGVNGQNPGASRHGQCPIFLCSKAWPIGDQGFGSHGLSQLDGVIGAA
jgi:hypothetical protein